MDTDKETINVEGIFGDDEICILGTEYPWKDKNKEVYVTLRMLKSSNNKYLVELYSPAEEPDNIKRYISVVFVKKRMLQQFAMSILDFLVNEEAYRLAAKEEKEDHGS